jgi:hypothetical protein
MLGLLTLTTLTAYWPWILGYILAAAGIFMIFRRFASTDDRAAALADQSGFGTPIGMAGAAVGYCKLRCARLLLVVTATAWIVRGVLGQWNWIDLAIGVGIVVTWPVQEWLVHVFLLHLKPFTLMGRRFDPIVASNHRNHHRNPWDPELGITPMHMIWIYAAGLPGIWAIAFAAPQAMTGVAMYLSLLLNYEWVHYLIHTSYVPRSALYRRLWRNHRLHHFKNEHFWYNVTMLSGDKLLHTRPSAQEAARSPTCLNLATDNEMASLTEPVAR